MTKALLMVGALVVVSGCGGQQPKAGVPSLNQSGESASTLNIPVRLSRAFFEKNLSGTVEVKRASEELARTDASIEWKELPPTAPAPTGEYIADFRDYQGCASYQDSYGVKICFTVVPDVSSVDLTADKIELRGMDEILAERGDCEEKPTLRFIDAQKETGAVRVSYLAEYASCPAAQVNLLLREA